MKIMFVAEDTNLRSFMDSLIKSLGHNCYHAQSGTDAINKLRSGILIDLIISDIKMNDGIGPALLLFLSKHTLKPPFIFYGPSNELEIIPHYRNYIGIIERNELYKLCDLIDELHTRPYNVLAKNDLTKYLTIRTL